MLQPNFNISALTNTFAIEDSYGHASDFRRQVSWLDNAIAVRLAFMKLEDQRVTQIHPHPNGGDVEDRLSTIYAKLTNTIYMISDHDLIRDGSDPRVR